MVRWDLSRYLSVRGLFGVPTWVYIAANVPVSKCCFFHFICKFDIRRLLILGPEHFDSEINQSGIITKMCEWAHPRDTAVIECSISTLLLHESSWGPNKAYRILVATIWLTLLFNTMFFFAVPYAFQVLAHKAIRIIFGTLWNRSVAPNYLCKFAS